MLNIPITPKSNLLEYLLVVVSLILKYKINHDKDTLQ